MDKPVFFLLAMLTSVWMIGETSLHNSPIEGRSCCELCTQSLDQGATVCLECKHYGSDDTCQVEQKEDHQEEICEVALVNSSSANCGEIPECSSSRTRFELTGNNGMPTAIFFTDPLGFLHAESLMNCAEAGVINIFSGGLRYKRSLEEVRLQVATRNIPLEKRLRTLRICPNIVLVLPLYEKENKEVFYITLKGLEKSIKLAYLCRDGYLIGVFVGNSHWVEFRPDDGEEEKIPSSEKFHVKTSYTHRRNPSRPLWQTRIDKYKLDSWINEINSCTGQKTCPKLVEYLDTFALFTREALRLKSVTIFFAAELDGCNNEFFGQKRMKLVHNWGRMSRALLLASDDTNGEISSAASEILLAKPSGRRDKEKEDKRQGKVAKPSGSNDKEKDEKRKGKAKMEYNDE